MLFLMFCIFLLFLMFGEMHGRFGCVFLFFIHFCRFYIFTDVSAQFMYTLNFIAAQLCMVEVAEPGFESITYSLVSMDHPVLIQIVAESLFELFRSRLLQQVIL